MRREIGVAVIGTGFMGKAHALAYRAVYGQYGYFLPPEISFRRSAFFFSRRTNNLLLNNTEAADASFCWRRHAFLRTQRFPANFSPQRPPTAASLMPQRLLARSKPWTAKCPASTQDIGNRDVCRHPHTTSYAQEVGHCDRHQHLTADDRRVSAFGGRQCCKTRIPAPSR